MKKEEIKNKNLIHKDYTFDYEINIEELNTKILKHPIFLVEFIQKILFWTILIKRNHFKFSYKNILKKFSSKKINKNKMEIKSNLNEISTNSEIVQQSITKIDEFKTEDQYSIYMNNKDVEKLSKEFNLDNSKRNVEINLIIKRKRIKEEKIEKINIKQLVDALAVKIKEKRELYIK